MLIGAHLLFQHLVVFSSDHAGGLVLHQLVCVCVRVCRCVCVCVCVCAWVCVCVCVCECVCMGVCVVYSQLKVQKSSLDLTA